ncbi:hypothetical protein GCWU000325_00860 [Alloprevotella tannerae ATCC 51259]|uniref:Uncharacterized protein n=1 Tax=Alloprevotella tannerae ATCC 51259 TaxID=626522 RepID=C9LF78_9BACT|nr:hypothetical protein GCWU000325_00860 [Alloprevotella tannerae ATCC 51259]
MEIITPSALVEHPPFLGNFHLCRKEKYCPLAPIEVKSAQAGSHK